MEYTLRFSSADPAAVADAVRRLPMIRETSPEGHTFEFRAETNDGNMPDAAMHIEPGGVYFCDNGGQGQQFLGIVIARLVARFGVVTIAELE